MPQMIGKYTVVGTIGSGATAQVYLGEQPGLERRVAIKRLASRLAAVPEFLQRFRNEALVMARLDHPNCVRVFDFFEGEGDAYLVTEYVEGASLRRVIDRAGRLTPQQSLGVLKGSLTGLAYAHDLGLIHRDLKPENILADGEGVSKLADFGQAQFRGDIDPAPGQSGSSSGTPTYMSPEQARGETGDVRSDVYSAGVILYEFLAGRPPFIADNPLAVMRAHGNEVAPPPSRHTTNLGAGVDRVVSTAMEKAPEARYQSAGEFLDALEEAAREAYGADWEAAASITALVGSAAAGTAVLTSGTGATASSTAAASVASAAVAEPVPIPHAGPAAAAPAAKRLGAALGVAGTALLVTGGIGLAGNGTGTPSSPTAPATPGAAAPAPRAPVVTSISAVFDSSASTTRYTLNTTDTNTKASWFWIKNPGCGSIVATAGGAGYFHNGCDQLLEARGVVGACIENSHGFNVYQRNARVGDGLPAAVAAAAGLAGDGFSVVASGLPPGTCIQYITGLNPRQASASPVPSPSPLPLPTASQSPSGSTAGSTNSRPLFAAIAGAGLLSLLAGLYLLFRRP